MKYLILSLLLTGCAHKHWKKKFEKMDKNNDGKVSRREFLAHKKSHFKEVDGNNDGYITMEEKKMWKKNRK